MALFDRLCKVEVKNNHTGVVSVFDQRFRIEFEYTKSLDNSESTNCGWVKIHNLSYETVLEFGGRRFCEVTLYTGYANDLDSFRPIFRAEATDISFRKDRGTITTIKVSSNFTDLVLGQKVSDTLPEDVKGREIVNKILDVSWTDKPHTLEVNQGILDRKYSYGYALHGTPKEILDDFCRANDLRWSVITSSPEDTLHISSRIPDDTVYTIAGKSIVLNAETGLIGLPYLKMEEVTKNVDDQLGKDEFDLNQKTRYKKDGSVNDKPAKKKKVGRFNVSCKALINSSVNVQTIIRVETDDSITDGLYRVQDAKFSGDTFGNEWYMELELRDGNELAETVSTGQTKTASKKPNAGSVPKNASNYDSPMRRIYAKYGYTPEEMAILKAQVEQESHFDPNVVSKAGARGLTQFMPPTAKEYGVIFGDSQQATDSQLDGQARYMRVLLKRYNGNMNNALTAYNWGLGNLDKYLATGSPPIPSEAANYAPSVLAKATKYKF